MLEVRPKRDVLSNVPWESWHFRFFHLETTGGFVGVCLFIAGSRAVDFRYRYCVALFIGRSVGHMYVHSYVRTAIFLVNLNVTRANYGSDLASGFRLCFSSCQQSLWVIFRGTFHAKIRFLTFFHPFFFVRKCFIVFDPPSEVFMFGNQVCVSLL